MTRRELLAAISAAAATPLLKGAASEGPTAPVSIARCPTYEADITSTLNGMFDQLGGLARLVRNKTVTIKVNMTGPPSTASAWPGACAHALHAPEAGGRHRVPDGPRRRQAHPLRGKRLGHGGPLEDVMLDFRLECARAAIGGSPAWSSKTPTRSARAKVCALQGSRAGLHVPGVRS